MDLQWNASATSTYGESKVIKIILSYYRLKKITSYSAFVECDVVTHDTAGGLWFSVILSDKSVTIVRMNTSKEIHEYKDANSHINKG